MIAHWMLYVAAVGVFVTLGALAMERAMRACALPQRWVWAAAIVLGLALPAAARWMPRPQEPAPVAHEAEPRGTRVPFPASVAPAKSRPRLDVAALDGPLAAGWMGLSATALLALLGAALVLERRRRRWPAAEVDGVPVLLSPATGPAVIGLFRSRIVLPEWVVRDAAPDVRALLLEHEREHVRAGDPRLLALGLAAVVLAPWNPAAWYGLRRLRLAIEVDCDARVLARRADVRAYGSLLLEVGRRGTGGRLLAAAFSEPASFLERRIRIMTSPRLRFPWLRAGGFGAAALALLAVACEAPGPVQTSPTAVGTRMESVRTETSTTTQAQQSGVRISRAAIDAAVRAHYPEVFRAAATDTTGLLFVIGENGVVERHERTQMRRPGSAPTEVVAAPERMKIRSELDRQNLEATVVDLVSFAPGQMGPGTVEILWVRNVGANDLTVTTEVDTVRMPAGTRMRTPAEGTRMRTPAPEGTQMRTPEPSQGTRMRTPAPGRQARITAEQARGYVQRYMPEVARNGTTAEYVWFLADASGRIVQHGDANAGGALDTFRNVVGDGMIFSGLELNGHKVPVMYMQLTS